MPSPESLRLEGPFEHVFCQYLSNRILFRDPYSLIALALISCARVRSVETYFHEAASRRLLTSELTGLAVPSGYTSGSRVSTA